MVLAEEPSPPLVRLMSAKDQKTEEKHSNFSFFPRKNVTGCILGWLAVDIHFAMWPQCARYVQWRGVFPGHYCAKADWNIHRIVT